MIIIPKINFIPLHHHTETDLAKDIYIYITHNPQDVATRHFNDYTTPKYATLRHQYYNIKI